MGHRHGGKSANLYGDDGEMQCSQCFCDFVRDSVDDMEKKIGDFNMRIALEEMNAKTSLHDS